MYVHGCECESTLKLSWTRIHQMEHDAEQLRLFNMLRPSLLRHWTCIILMDTGMLLKKKKLFGIKKKKQDISRETTVSHTHTHTHAHTRTRRGAAAQLEERGTAARRRASPNTLIRSGALASRSESSPAAGRAELWKVN